MAAVLEKLDSCELQTLVFAPAALAGLPYRGLDVSGYTLSQSTPDWLSGALKKIVNFGRLEARWDSYSAKVIPASTRVAAVTLLREIATQNLPPAHVVPVSDGSIQIEWHTRGIDLELNVVSASRVTLSFEDARGTFPALEEELRYDLRKLTNILDLIASRPD